MLDLANDTQTLTSFCGQSAKFIEQLRKSKRPLRLTVREKAVAIVQDPEAYQRLLDIAALADEHEAIR